MNKDVCFGFTAVLNKIGCTNDDLFVCTNKVVNKHISCYYHPLQKFLDDKICQENEDFFIVLDGIVLNKKQLLEKAGCTDWFLYLVTLYEQNGDSFFKDLRGSFCGILWDKRKKRYIVFTDQIGSKFVYYTQNGESICCSTMIANLYKYRHDNQLKCTCSTSGAFMLMTYGFMLEDYTLCEEIRKVQPGCYILFENGVVKEKRYCVLDNTPDYSMSEDDAIELYDSEFRRVISLEFEKDKEYGYRHLVALSGGLDSRMTSWVAHEMGYTDQLNITFSQSNYADEKVAKQIASDLKHEWLFKALDNGMWLYNVDEVISVTGGNALYYGQAHGYSLYKYLNCDNFGILHSGQLGGGVMGAHISSNDIPFHYGDGAYSKKYIEYLSNIKLQEYPNKEIGMYYCRLFNGTLQGQIICYPYVETTAPFIDWDLMCALKHVPASMRYKHNLYKKWILHKYPKAGDYIWESTGHKITAKELKIGNRSIPYANIPKSIIEHLNMFLKRPKKYTEGMNPIGLYLNNNPTLSSFLLDYFKYIEVIDDSELRDVVLDIRDNGTAIEKIQAVTLMGALKLFFL